MPPEPHFRLVFSDPSPSLAERGSWYRVYEAGGSRLPAAAILVSFMVCGETGAFAIDVSVDGDGYGDDGDDGDIAVRFLAQGRDDPVEVKVLDGLRDRVAVPPAAVRSCARLVLATGERAVPARFLAFVAAEETPLTRG